MLFVNLIKQSEFKCLGQYLYWGRVKEEEFENFTFWFDKYENCNDINFFYNIIKNLINIYTYKAHNYLDDLEGAGPFVRGIFTSSGVFPNYTSTSNIELCKFLRNHKMEQTTIISDNGNKIDSSLQLLIDIYNREQINKLISEYTELINVGEDEDLSIFLDEALAGGYKLNKLIGGRPIKQTQKNCKDLLKDINDFIQKYMEGDEVEKFKSLKKLINRKKKIEILIKLLTVKEKTEKIPELNALLDEVNEQINQIFIDINQLFITVGQEINLNKLGKYIYKSINGENYDKDDNFVDDDTTDPRFERVETQGSPKQTQSSDEDDSDEDDSREDDSREDDSRAHRTPNLDNSGNTCYMNSFLQAINATTSFRNFLIKHTEQCKENRVIKSLRDTLNLLSSGIDEKVVNIKKLFCESVWELLIEQDIRDEINIKKRDLTDEEIAIIREKKMKSQRDSLESLLKIISIINSSQCNGGTELPELEYLLITMLPAVGQIPLEIFLENQKITAIEDKNKTLEYNIRENKKWAKIVLDALDKGGKIADFQYSDDKLRNYIPSTILKDASVETLQKFMDEVYKPVTEDDFQDVLTKKIKFTLLQRPHVPFIIIQNPFSINTINNGQITIEGQTFILKAAIIKSGGQQFGHYWTVTQEGLFDDQKPKAFYHSKYMEKIIKDGTFRRKNIYGEIEIFPVYAYFFENIEQRGGGYLNKPYLSGGESMKDKYFYKYLKYKNKYLELSKLKSQKIGRY